MQAEPWKLVGSLLLDRTPAFVCLFADLLAPSHVLVVHPRPALHLCLLCPLSDPVEYEDGEESWIRKLGEEWGKRPSSQNEDGAQENEGQ